MALFFQNRSKARLGFVSEKEVTQQVVSKLASFRKTAAKPWFVRQIRTMEGGSGLIRS